MLESQAVFTIPPLFAHRFGREYGPDSSRASLDHVLAGNVDGLETDCCVTRDDVIVLLHDPFLPHAVGIDGWTSDLDAREILASRLQTSEGKRSDEHPLTLQELLADARIADLVLQLDIKAYANSGLAQRTADLVCREVLRSGFPAEQCEIVSFWPGACACAGAHGLRSRLIVACAYAPDALAAWAVAARVTGVILEAPYFAHAPIDIWRAAGLSVMSGVVNDALLAEVVLPFGPDAICTDRPHELRTALRALGHDVAG
jgi:glycerophosphoryl diester phosphodiesterase